MNKKGNLLTSEVLKIVVGVICVGFLVYFIGALYFSNVLDKKTIEAESLMEKIKGELLNMELQELSGFEVYDIAPDKWWVFGFVSPEIGPNLCSGENCLCVCKKSDGLFGNNDEKQLMGCDKDGACVAIENLKDFSEFKIGEEEGSFTSLSFKSVSGFLEVEEI